MQVLLPGRDIVVFREALETLNASGLPYMIGGAFAMYHYSGAWRNTDDLDVYMEQRNVPPAVQALCGRGFSDYGEMAVGDRDWIYHATKDGVLVDIIWAPPNRLSAMDPNVYERAQSGSFLDMPVKFLPPDELVYSKIFTMNHQRSDWPDVFKIIRARPEDLNWDHLLAKLGDNWPVLLSFIILFDWVYPSEAEVIPGPLRDDLIRKALDHHPNPDTPTREAVLDPWIYTRPAKDS